MSPSGTDRPSRRDAKAVRPAIASAWAIPLAQAAPIAPPLGINHRSSAMFTTPMTMLKPIRNDCCSVIRSRSCTGTSAPRSTASPATMAMTGMASVYFGP